MSAALSTAPTCLSLVAHLPVVDRNERLDPLAQHLLRHLPLLPLGLEGLAGGLFVQDKVGGDDRADEELHEEERPEADEDDEVHVCQRVGVEHPLHAGPWGVGAEVPKRQWKVGETSRKDSDKGSEASRKGSGKEVERSRESSETGR